MRKRKKLSPKAERRAKARAAEKLAKKREKLAKIEAGGSPERPIEVVSASVVEPAATSMPCPTCLGACRVEEHAAETVDGKRLRIARMLCVQCGAKRAVYFKIVGQPLN
jgi:ferredoxin